MQVSVPMPHILEAMPCNSPSCQAQQTDLPERPLTFSFFDPSGRLSISRENWMVGDWKNLCQSLPFLDHPQIEVDPAIASVRPWPGHKFPRSVNLGPDNRLTPCLACAPHQASVADREAQARFLCWLQALALQVDNGELALSVLLQGDGYSQEGIPFRIYA